MNKSTTEPWFSQSQRMAEIDAEIDAGAASLAPLSVGAWPADLVQRLNRLALEYAELAATMAALDGKTPD